MIKQKKWIFETLLIIGMFFGTGLLNAQINGTCTTTKDMPICIVADANGIGSKEISFSVTYDTKADPYVDKLVVTITSTEVVGMAGGSFIQELLSVNPKDGRLNSTGKKKYPIGASGLVPGKKYTLSAVSFLGLTETHKKVVTSTTKNSTTLSTVSGTGTGTTPMGTGTGTTPSGTGTGTTPGGTGFSHVQTAETQTAPGGLIV